MNTTKSLALITQMFFLLHGTVAFAAGEQSAPIRDKWAVVVGVSKHIDPSIVPLKFAAKNATDFADFLVKSEHFAPDHVQLLLDEKATRLGIYQAVGNNFLPRNAMPNDLVVIYLSGASSPAEMDAKKVTFFLPYDAQSSQLFATGISFADLPRNFATRIHSDSIVIFTDASYSGGNVESRASNIRGSVGNGSTVISACGRNEKACESNKLQNGIFTHYLIEDLKKAGPDSSLRSALKSLPDEVLSAAKKENSADNTLWDRLILQPSTQLLEPCQPNLAASINVYQRTRDFTLTDCFSISKSSSAR